MSDDRPALDPVEALAELQRRLADLETTTAARMLRRPTGDVEMTLRLTPKPDTLLLQGQTLSRATYPALWKWITDNGLSPSVFGAGDGATSFTLPNMQGRVPIGAGRLAFTGTGGDDTYVVGQIGGVAWREIGLGALPNHSHGGGITDWSDRTHVHGGSTDDNQGAHGGHVTGSVNQVGYAPSPDPSWTRVSSWGNGASGHEHHFTTATESQGHKHAFSTSAAGDGNPFDVRQPHLAFNFLIWT